MYGKCKCFVMSMLYICVLCVSCGSSQCYVLYDLRFVNAGRGCKNGPYRRGIIHSRTHVVVSAFIICRGLCSCIEMV